MGFFDSLGSALGNAMRDGQNKYQETLGATKRMSDDELVRRYKSASSQAEKMAYLKALNLRGYGHQNDE